MQRGTSAMQRGTSAMQRGSCFPTYEDFKARFKAYTEETQNSYGIQSSISVRYHNSKNAANVRPDIMYVEVKFCCSELQGHNHKRKSKSCPAYFILQYNEGMDCLVVSEEDSNHIHTEKDTKSAKLQESGTSPKKLFSKKPSAHMSKEDDDDGTLQTFSLSLNEINVKEDNITETLTHATNSTTEMVMNECPQEELVGLPVMRLAAVVNSFLLCDPGSLAIMNTGNREELLRLSFQTSKMRSMFLKFPEILLLHRVPSKDSLVLYAFLVENKDRVGKVVFFSFLKEDSAENVSKMFSVFRGFNPECTKVKVIFTDPLFIHKAILKETFPSAQLLLSMYHTVCLIKSKIKGTPSSVEFLKRSLDEVVYCTSPDKVSNLAEKLQHELDKDLYDFLNINWFACELVWYMHVKKGLHSCSTYMHSLEQVTTKISSLFGHLSSLEWGIQQFLEYADCFNSKGLENIGDGSRTFSKPNTKTSSRSNKVNPCSKTSKQCINLPPHRFKPLACRTQPNQSLTAFSGPELTSTSAKQLFHQNISSSSKVNLQPSLVSEAIKSSLQEHCTPMGFHLCLKEFEVLQKSTQIINVQENFIAVQLLEESHQVSADGRTCTCYFSSLYRLPCRHILGHLNANKKPVGEAMVCKHWQRQDLQHSTLTEEEFQKSLRFSNNKKEAWKRISMIKSLAAELSNLLLQCGGTELEVRLSTLQMIVDIWTKEQYPENGQCTSLEGSNELPYQWVKKEPSEGEDHFGCHELYRVDAHCQK